MGPSSRSCAAGAVVVALASLVPACTFTGLGDYSIGTCSKPLGTTSTVQTVGALGSSNDIVFTQVAGQTPLAAFTNEVGGTSCVEGVGARGALASGCDFFGSNAISPRQPWITPLGGGYLVAAIATTAPCTQGQLSVQFGPGQGSLASTKCSSASPGAALPAAVVIPGGSNALVAWYETSITSRADPLQDCAGASAAPLQIAVLEGATGTSPVIGPNKTLTSKSIGVRPAAVTPLASEAVVAVAAPDGAGASLWTVDGDLAVHGPTAIASLEGARAVAMGADTAGHIAVVAEIGCAPQTIALALGTTSGGFGPAITIAPAASSFALGPSVAWVASEGYWLVSWISGDGGAHALAQRVAPDGALVGERLDPSIRATAATVVASAPSVPDGSLLAYVPGGPAGGSVVSTSLGCVDQRSP